MEAEDEGCWIGVGGDGWEVERDLRAGECATLDVGSSPGGAEYVFWTCHHRIRNRRRDSPLYTVGKLVLSHRISGRKKRGVVSKADDRIGYESMDTRTRTILRLRQERQAVPLWRGYAPWGCRW